MAERQLKDARDINTIRFYLKINS